MVVHSIELSIIIVNWNGADFLPNCLRSIVENPPSFPFEVIVVDNASSDGSVEWMKSEDDIKWPPFAKFTLIENQENVGFGRANNQAIDMTSSPFVFILNPDTRVERNAINKLIATLRSDKQIGMTAPKMLNNDRTAQPSVSTFPPTPFSIAIEGLQLYRFLPRKFLAQRLFGRHWDYNERIPVPIVAGAAMMCRREMIDDVGGFDPSIHMYGEDLEWCVRIWRKGWTIVFEPEAGVYHEGGKSAEQRWAADEIGFIQERAIIDFNRSNFSGSLNCINSVTTIFVMLLHLVRWKLSGKNTVIISRILKLHANNCRYLITKRIK